MFYDLVVVGGGPAGMMGAATAGGKGLKVVLLEKNDRLGKKLSITGNGRCNVTNSGGVDDFQKNIVTNRKFLYSALNSFNNLRLIALLKALGVKTKVERGNRVFPVSDKSGDIIEALRILLENNAVEVKLKSEVKQIKLHDGRVSGVLLEDGSLVAGKNALIATGGMSYRQTGSTGAGYRMAQDLGHTVVKPRPALVSLVSVETWARDLQGLTLENVKIQALVDSGVKAEQAGELLFTHFGVSGPAVLNLSSQISKWLDFPVRLRINLVPQLSSEQVENQLGSMIKKNPGKLLKNVLGELLPQRMIPVIMGLAGMEIHRQVDQVTRGERKHLAYTLKNVILTVRGASSLNDAIVTGGGVDTRQINPSTLGSKMIKGLYFAGEVIDVDALTGGYNLQIAFSTGYLSGLSACGDCAKNS